MRPHPLLFEINARPWLRRLSAEAGRRLTLSTVPDAYWRRLAGLGFDLVWLMGAWRRSPAARDAALRDPGLRDLYGHALPGWSEADVQGSPYAVLEYSLDPALGEEGELAELRSRLAKAGLRLMLDFVPNHLARDHAWTRSFPGRFVGGPAPGAPASWYFRSASGRLLAHGRDPNFAPWSDTVQVDFFSSELREALERELARIARQCDGLRCDMAMLGLNSVFERVWGPYGASPRPAKEFWTGAIAAAKGANPDLLLLAEAYWGHEWELQELGFDFTYDKTLYDRLLHAGAGEVLAHLRPDGAYQRRSAHFVENHDEPRAAAVFGRERSFAAAAVCATIPGLRFFHDGQLEGRRSRLPVQLAREPQEAPDRELQQRYEALLHRTSREPFRTGRWEVVDAAPAGDGTHARLLAWRWTAGGDSVLVVINHASEPSRGVVAGRTVEAGPWDVRFLGPASEP